METQPNDQDYLVNYDNDNDNDDLGYESEVYLDEEKEDGNNHSDGNVVKRGITRLSKFRREYGKPNGIKLSVTFDALNRISGSHRALFFSFLGDLVREHIGLKILSWKKRYFDVDLTVRKLVMNRLGQLIRNFRRKLRQTYILPNQNTLSKLNAVPTKYSAILTAEEWVNFVKYMTTEEYQVKSAAAKMVRSKSVYQHIMVQGGYTHVKQKMIENKEIKPDEEPPRGIMWLKGRVNKDGKFQNDEIRSVGDKLKETEDKIKEGTLRVDHGTDAMIVVLGKEKGGYERGVGSGVTYKRYFELPRSRQASDKELCYFKLAAQREQLQSMSTKLTPSDVSLVDINPIDSSADEEGGTPLSVVGCENDASIQKSNRLATSEKEMETRETVNSVGSKKTTKSLRKESSRQDSQSQENVSPLLVLPQHLKKSTIIALGTAYKTDGKQMLHNKELPKDCYKVSVDKSLVDAACIPDVGNNGFKIVKDAVGGFFAWPKNQVVLAPKETPPIAIQMIDENKTAPKLQMKRKNVYVSNDAMHREAKNKSYRALSVLAYQLRFSAYLAVNLVLRVMSLVLLNLFRTRKNEVLFSEEVPVLKREVGIKQYEINMLKTEFEKLKQEKDAIDFKIEKFGLVESPVVVKKKTVFPTAAKIEFVRPKQHEKPVRKPVKYAEMYRSQRPRGNQRNWNNQKSQQLGSDFVMNNKACFVCGSFDHLKKDCGKRIIKPVWKNTRRVNDHYSTRMTHSNPRRNMIPQAVLMRSGIKAVNTAKPKDAHNAVKRNRFNTVKASACWVWMPKNRVIDHGRNNAQIDEDHFGSDGCTDSGEAGVQQRQKIMMKGRGFPEQKVNYKFKGGLLGIKLSALSTAKSKVRLKTAGYKVSTADLRLLLLVKKLMLDVPNDVIKLMMFPYSLEGAARVWYDKEPPNSILTWDDLVNKFVNQFFPPSKTTHLKNEISRFTQKFEETFGEAWERFKEMLRACPHHGFTELTQIDTFYNGLNENDQDSLNAAAGGNLLSKTTREALNIIENKSKVRYSRNKPNVSRVNTNSRESSSKTDERIDKLADQISTLVEIVTKKVVTPATVKAVEESCVICGDAHAYYNCTATDSNQSSVCAATASTSGTLPSNTIPKSRGEMKAITTRSGVAYEGPSIPTNPSPKKVVERETEETTDKEQTNFQGSTAHIQPPVNPISILEPDFSKNLPKPNIPYPSRLNDQKLREKATNQMEKFFQDLHFDISFADALLLMPKFASTIKSLLTNKDKLFELAKIPLNENCSAMLLKKLLENLGDPDKFLIPCDFPRMDVCHALADLGASIFLMPRSHME
ncbi:reverse transcriptase domain-containing protein [Tanacetum coccineum]